MQKMKRRLKHFILCGGPYDYSQLFGASATYYDEFGKQIVGGTILGDYPEEPHNYRSSGIVLEELFEERAVEMGFTPCSVCM